MENKFIQGTYKPETGTCKELFDTLSRARDPDYHHLMGYCGVDSVGKIYHLNGCTVRLQNGPRSYPLNVSGDSEMVESAISKLEKLAETKLIKVY